RAFAHAPGRVPEVRFHRLVQKDPALDAAPQDFVVAYLACDRFARLALVAVMLVEGLQPAPQLVRRDRAGREKAAEKGLNQVGVVRQTVVGLAFALRGRGGQGVEQRTDAVDRQAVLQTVEDADGPVFERQLRR